MKALFIGEGNHDIGPRGECCEGVFNTHPDVFRTALVGVGVKGFQTPIICVELEAGAKDKNREVLRSELRALAQKFLHTDSISTFLFHKKFPVDIRHNAKIIREQLAVWAQESSWYSP
jgi:acyl-coenzyme A synthetase/AMP-(fatty) acid ligase